MSPFRRVLGMEQGCRIAENLTTPVIIAVDGRLEGLLAYGVRVLRWPDWLTCTHTTVIMNFAPAIAPVVAGTPASGTTGRSGTTRK